GSRTTGQHAVQGRGWIATATGSLPDIPQLLLASRRSTPGAAATRTDQRHGQTLAAADTSHGGRMDRARVDLERGAAVSRAAVAAVPKRVSDWRGRSIMGAARAKCARRWTKNLSGKSIYLSYFIREGDVVTTLTRDADYA